MDFRDYLKNNIVILDGGMGTLLQQKGLSPGELPELWNITKPDIIREIHKEYFNAGSNVVNINTFGANRFKFSEDILDDIIRCAVKNASDARELSSATQQMYISLDIGPLGKLLKPYGELEFEEAISSFADIVRLGVKYGVDLITIETMGDSYETKAAVLAAKENSDLPIIVSNAYGSDQKLMTGASPGAMVALLEGLRVDALGANCSLGPAQLRDISDELLKYSSIPVLIKPNAGMPRLVDNQTVYDVSVAEFGEIVSEMVKKGVRIVGGCCGTTPEYIKKIAEKISNIDPVPLTSKNFTVVSSFAQRKDFGEKTILIGERINPTGKKRFKQALVEHDIDYILKEGIQQQEKGVDILDVNVGLPEIDERSMLKEVIESLQSIIDLPLQIDSADSSAMESAMRIYNGKPMVNSVNGTVESMNSIFPLVKKYGGLIVALTLDEKGIPNTFEGRINIANKIISEAKKYGIEKKDIIFDTLAMTVSTDNEAAKTTIKALSYIKNVIGCHTSLGISNISFGLPARDYINSTFFACALSNGLSAAIMNPYSVQMMNTYHSFNALYGFDDNCLTYVDYFSNPNNFTQSGSSISVLPPKPSSETDASELHRSIRQGRKDTCEALTEALLITKEPLKIIEEDIIPALDAVGKDFEKKRAFLPQLLMSAEAAKNSFNKIRESMKSGDTSNNITDFSIVIATVKGDIHDIGKNIVKLLLENYGFKVYDLGKDVDPETIVQKVISENASLCCLSALMTTTVPAMQQTIELLRKNVPSIKIMVGGAVLTPEYASRIGADFYAKDAMESVRIASSLT